MEIKGCCITMTYDVSHLNFDVINTNRYIADFSLIALQNHRSGVITARRCYITDSNYGENKSTYDDIEL